MGFRTQPDGPHHALGKPLILSMKLRYQILTALYATGLLAVFCVVPAPKGAPQETTITLLIHAVLFGGLAAIVGTGLVRSHPTISPVLLFAVPVLIAASYGLLIELIQIGIPGRAFEWSDVPADAAGAVVAQSVCRRFVGRRAVRSAPK